MHQCWAYMLIAFISLVSLSCSMERIQGVAKAVMSLKMEWCLTKRKAYFLVLCSFGRSDAESLGPWCTSFQDSTLVSPSWVKMSKKIRLRHFDPLRCCLKTSGTNYPLPQHHIPKKTQVTTKSLQKPENLYSILFWIYRVSQEECARLREGVPYVKVYRYNPKHLCPKLNS